MLLAISGRKFVLPKLLELKLANAVEDNKEILKDINNKRRTRKNIGLLHDNNGHLTVRTQTKQRCLMSSLPLFSVLEKLWRKLCCY